MSGSDIYDTEHGMVLCTSYLDKYLNEDSIVQLCDGTLCTVEGIQSFADRRVVLKRIHTHELVEAAFSDICGILVQVTDKPSRHRRRQQ